VARKKHKVGGEQKKPAQGPLGAPVTGAFNFPAPRKPHIRRPRRPEEMTGVKSPVPVATGPFYGDPNASVSTSAPKPKSD
jgi:hypothetical protein